MSLVMVRNQFFETLIKLHGSSDKCIIVDIYCTRKNFQSLDPIASQFTILDFCTGKRHQIMGLVRVEAVKKCHMYGLRGWKQRK